MSEDVVWPDGFGDAPEGVSLDQYAEIAARLAIGTDEPERDVLARLQVDEERFRIARKIWAKRIEDEVAQAARPGLTSSAEERFSLSMRYAVIYAEVAKNAREPSTRALPAGEAGRE